MRPVYTGVHGHGLRSFTTCVTVQMPVKKPLWLGTNVTDFNNAIH